jgi:hypothetical protein
MQCHTGNCNEYFSQNENYERNVDVFVWVTRNKFSGNLADVVVYRSSTIDVELRTH